MPRSAFPDSLTSEQQAEADRIDTALVAADEDIRALAIQMATTTDATRFGENEFTLRDIVLRVAAEDLEIALVAADRTGVGTQGPQASAADGRMAATGMIWNAGEEGRVRYACGLTGGLAALGEPLRRPAAQVHMAAAQRWVAIADGGTGIEDWLRTNFPRVEVAILDFDHAAEHQCDWAKAVHPREPRPNASVRRGAVDRSTRAAGRCWRHVSLGA